MAQSESIANLAAALSKAQGEMNGAVKGSDNPFFKSKYADLYECIEATKEQLSKHELTVIQTTDSDEKGIWVYTTLAHSSGEWINSRILMKPKKDDDQSAGSSITYGRRYGYAAIIGLAQKDDDGNGSTGNNGDHTSEWGKGDAKKGKQPDPKTTSEYWEQEADKNATSVLTLKAWMTGVWKQIEALLPADEMKKFLSYKDQLKASLEEDHGKQINAPKTWSCPEGGKQVTDVECGECTQRDKCSMAYGGK